MNILQGLSSPKLQNRGADAPLCDNTAIRLHCYVPVSQSAQVADLLHPVSQPDQTTNLSHPCFTVRPVLQALTVFGILATPSAA